MAAVGYQRVVIDTAMYFGLFFIVVLSLNFQYGNAGVPNIGLAVSVIVGVRAAVSLFTNVQPRVRTKGTHAKISDIMYVNSCSILLYGLF